MNCFLIDKVGSGFIVPLNSGTLYAWLYFWAVIYKPYTFSFLCKGYLTATVAIWTFPLDIQRIFDRIILLAFL
jgi:hypothetical protein